MIARPDVSGRQDSAAGEPAAWLARYLLLGGVILLGAALRFYALGAKSLWGDEINTAVKFVRLPAWDIVTHLDPNNHPLFSLLAHLFTLQGANPPLPAAGIGGPGQEFLLRVPAALLGIAAIPAVYRLGRAAVSPGVGLGAAFLLAISPYHLGYSQEARGYSALVLFTTLSLLYLLRAIKTGERRHSRQKRPDAGPVAAFAVATVLALYSHLFAALPIGAALCLLAVYGLADLRAGRLLRFRLRAWAVTMLFIAVAIAVLYAPLWLASPQAPEGTPLGAFRGLGLIDRSYIGDYAGRLGFATDWKGLASVIDLAQRFGGGWGGQWQPVAVISSALFWIGLVLTIGRSRSTGILASWLALPFLFAEIISRLWAGFYVYSRFYVFMLPVYLVFVACGLAWLARGLGALRDSRVGHQIRDRWLRRLRVRLPRWLLKDAGLIVSFGLAVVLLGTTGLPALRHYYATERQDWRGVGQYLLRNVGPGDRVVQLWLLQPNSLAWYYHPTDPTIQVLQARAVHADSSDFTGSDVWWVMVHDGHLNRLRQLAGSEFDVVPFAWLAVVHRRDGPPAPLAALDSTITLLEIQRDLSSTDRLAYQDVVDRLVGVGPASRAQRGSGYQVARHYLDQGDAEAGRHDWAAALHSYLRATAAWPQWGMAHTKLGNAYRALGRPDDAAAAYRQAIQVEPGYVGAYLNLGALLEGQGQREPALSLYRDALAVAPDSAWAHTMLGQALLPAAEALSHLERAVELEPGKVDWLLALADGYRDVGRREEAIAAYRQVIALDPTNEKAAQALRALRAVAP